VVFVLLEQDVPDAVLLQERLRAPEHLELMPLHVELQQTDGFADVRVEAGQAHGVDRRRMSEWTERCAD
jgi:hypothetical protein